MKKKILAAVMSAVCLFSAAVPSGIALADGQKVVTLGADLSQDQKDAILRYFGVYGQNLQTLTITNTDERNHLGSYVPLEQIGTRTYSCALVSPTSSGGIQVKTANLSWVTSNMIASTLSTSGVVNCDVLAASPFEVSGTGALTGILMAYETAVGTTLDTTKKEVATQELITTTTIANNIGQVNATEIINDTKIQVIEGNVISDNDIDIIINEVAQEQEISLSEEDKALIADLMKKIAEQDYDYEEMKQTLERVENNLEQLSAADTETPDQTEVPDQADAPDQTDTPDQTEALDPDSILLNTDDSALGENVKMDATDSSALTETEAAPDTESVGFEITTSDTYTADAGVSNEGGTAAEAGVSSEEGAVADGGISIEDSTADSSSSETTGSVVVLEGTDTAAVPETSEAAEVQGDAVSDILPEEQGAEVDPALQEPVAAPIAAAEMKFAPVTSEANGYLTCNAGENRLTVYVPVDSITAGTGTLTVTNQADGSVFETIQMNDTEKVAFQSMDGEELALQGWASGMKAVIYLTSPLAQNSQYSVTLSEDAIMTADGQSHSEAVMEGWNIETGAVGFYIEAKAPGFTSGSTAAAHLMMDGTGAVYADIENADTAMVAFDQVEFDPSNTSCNITFTGFGKTTFTVGFYGEDGSWIGSVEYPLNIQ